MNEEHQEFPADSPAKLLVKFSVDGDRRYIAGELEGEFEGVGKALESYESIRERYKDELGPSPLEVFFDGLTLEKVVDSFTEETAAAMIFPLETVKRKPYPRSTVGKVFMKDSGLVDWVSRKIPFDEESDITKKLGIAACVWYFTDNEEGAY